MLGRVPLAFALVLLLAVAALLLTGCGQHLGGTNDVALDYKIDTSGLGDKAPKTAEGWQSYVQQRMLVAQCPADVEPLGADTIRVTVDGDDADYADDMMRWRGGVKLYAVDPSYVFTPQDTTGLTPKRDGDEEFWTGAPAVIAHQVYTAPTTPGHRVLLERVNADTYRTRAVVADPIVDLSSALAGVGLTDGGRAVDLIPNDAAKTVLQQAAAAAPGARMAVVRGSTLLSVQTTDDLAKSPIIISYASQGIVSYTYAKALEQILLTVTLPPMSRIAAVHVPSRWLIAVLCLVLPMLISFGWLAFVRQFDRARPEPVWLVLATFALGGLACFPAGLLERGLGLLSPYLDPRVVSLGGQWKGLPLALPVFFLCVGVVEEGGKFLGAWSLAFHRHEFDEPVDGIVYGCAAALGFAAVENVKYFTELRLESSIVAARAFMSVPAHMFFGTIWGYALGRKLVRKKTRVFGFFLLAALAHAIFDALLGFPIGILGGIAVQVVLAASFIFLLRSALRHGVVEIPATEAPQSRERLTFRVGAPLPFYSSAAALLVLAAAVVDLGSAYDETEQRATALFLVLLTGLLALVGLAIYLVATTIPLDVVVDSRGVTFAGARTDWANIRGIERRHAKGIFGHRGWLSIATAKGPVRIGPAPSARIEQIAGTMTSFLSSRGARPDAASASAE